MSLPERCECCEERITTQPVIDPEEGTAFCYRYAYELAGAAAASIQKAASDYFREFDHLIGDEDYPERAALREALGKS